MAAHRVTGLKSFGYSRYWLWLELTESKLEAVIECFRPIESKTTEQTSLQLQANVPNTNLNKIGYDSKNKSISQSDFCVYIFRGMSWRVQWESVWSYVSWHVIGHCLGSGPMALALPIAYNWHYCWQLCFCINLSCRRVQCAGVATPTAIKSYRGFTTRSTSPPSSANG